MRRDKNAPRLYELLGGGSGGQTDDAGAERLPRPVPMRPVRPAEPTDAGAKSWLTPGRTLRVPVGYVFIAAAIVVMAGVLGYFAGYSKRSGEVRREAAREAARTDPAMQPAPQVRDPLVDGSQASSDGRSEGGSGGAPQLLIIEKGDPDPRVPGLNYLVVATLPPEAGVKAAEFLVASGLPAARLAPEDEGWCKVVVLRGFESWEAVDSPQRRELEARVLDIGRDFKRAERVDDFSSMFMKKYTGG